MNYAERELLKEITTDKTMKLFEKANINKIDKKLLWIYNEEIPRSKVLNVIKIAIAYEKDNSVMTDKTIKMIEHNGMIPVIEMLLKNDILEGSVNYFKVKNEYK